jgi:hypothetical protein
MSFEDYYEVDIDVEDRTFTIIRNNGTVHTYSIDQEGELFNNILQHSDEVEIYELS